MKNHDDQYGRIFSLLGGLSGKGIEVFMKMKGRDLTLAECLGSLFLIV